MLYYWKTQDYLVDYFCFQILYEVLMLGKLSVHRCPIVSDTIPHALQSYLSDRNYFETKEEIMQKTGLHKLSYKTVNATKLLSALGSSTN
jgi:hypothetical protein